MIYLLKQDLDNTTRSTAQPVGYTFDKEIAKKWVDQTSSMDRREYEELTELVL